MAEKLIKFPLVVFSSHEKFPNLIGYVSYEGDLGKEEPRLFYLDTQKKTLSLKYRSGREEQIATLDEDNSDLIHDLEHDIHDAGVDPQMGFFRCSEAGDMIDPCYNVDVIVI